MSDMAFPDLWFWIIWIVTLILSVIFTRVQRRLAPQLGLLDHPRDPRKHHRSSMPLGGGLAVVVAFLVGSSLLWPQLTAGFIQPKHLIGLMIALLLMSLGGLLDDRYNISPRWQIIFPFTACIVIIASGVGIDFITSPFGGTIRLDKWSWQIAQWNGTPYFVTLPADLFTIVWLLTMSYTTKLLDGLDGLVSGITVIGAGLIAILSLTTLVYQPEIAWLSGLLIAAFLGFLYFNWYPATIFLGDGGSLVAGFSLGVLSILSGSKVATALLVFAIPMIDIAWVVFQRVRAGRSPFTADRTHIHLRLLDKGWPVRRIVIVFYLIALLFGSTTLLLQTTPKVMMLVLALLTAIGLIIYTTYDHATGKDS